MERGAGEGERRGAPRVSTRLAVAYEDDDRQVFLRARDVSERGIFLLDPAPPAPGVGARLVLELPGHAELLRLRGTVRRTQRSPRSGFAVQFQAGSPLALLALRAYVQDSLAAAGDGPE